MDNGTHTKIEFRLTGKGTSGVVITTVDKLGHITRSTVDIEGTDDLKKALQAHAEIVARVMAAEPAFTNSDISPLIRDNVAQ